MQNSPNHQLSSPQKWLLAGAIIFIGSIVGQFALSPINSRLVQNMPEVSYPQPTAAETAAFDHWSKQSLRISQLTILSYAVSIVGAIVLINGIVQTILAKKRRQGTQTSTSISISVQNSPSQKLQNYSSTCLTMGVISAISGFLVGAAALYYSSRTHSQFGDGLRLLVFLAIAAIITLTCSIIALVNLIRGLMIRRSFPASAEDVRKLILGFMLSIAPIIITIIIIIIGQFI